MADSSQSCRWSGGGFVHVLTRGWCPLDQEVAGVGFSLALWEIAVRTLELHGGTWSMLVIIVGPSWNPLGMAGP